MKTEPQTPERETRGGRMDALAMWIGYAVIVSTSLAFTACLTWMCIDYFVKESGLTIAVVTYLLKRRPR